MLLAITPGDGRNLLPWLKVLLDAGLEAVLWRERSVPDDEVAALMRTLRLGVVHARCGVVPGLGSHFAAGTRPTSEHRRPFGASTHGLVEIDAASRWSDYLLLSPIWHPTSKATDRREPIGLSALTAARERYPMSTILALGGVTPERYQAALDVGADGAAVLGDLFGRSSPEEAARQLLRYRLA